MTDLARPISPDLDRLRRLRDTFLEELRALPPPALTWSPAPDQWSLLQVAEHLLLVEEVLLKALAGGADRASRRTLRHRVGGLAVAMVFRLGLRVRTPTRRVVPAGAAGLPEVEERWNRVREELVGRLASIPQDRRGDTLFTHPVAGPLDLYGGLAFILAHFQHHMRQVTRIRHHPGFPRPGTHR